jgi:hypothetical protein
MTTTEPDLFAGPELTDAERADLEDYVAVMTEAARDPDVGDYTGLTPGMLVCNCLCGRLLLARRHAHLRPDMYAVTDSDALPPVLFRKRVMRCGDVTRTVPVCRECEQDGTAAVRCAGGGRYALGAGGEG